MCTEFPLPSIHTPEPPINTTHRLTLRNTAAAAEQHHPAQHEERQRVRHQVPEPAVQERCEQDPRQPGHAPRPDPELVEIHKRQHEIHHLHHPHHQQQAEQQHGMRLDHAPLG